MSAVKPRVPCHQDCRHPLCVAQKRKDREAKVEALALTVRLAVDPQLHSARDALVELVMLAKGT